MAEHNLADCYVLFQVTKLIEESTVSKTVKNAIDTDRLLDWLVENSVLSIALEGQPLCLFHMAQNSQAQLITKCNQFAIKIFVYSHFILKNLHSIAKL